VRNDKMVVGDELMGL